MHIGIDFDNTIAGYDPLIRRTAFEKGWICEVDQGSKRTIRDAIRNLPDGEGKWTELQAEIYGPRMGEAELIDGVAEFFDNCRSRDARVSIISHKTRFAAAAPGKTDLRQAALSWMKAHRFFEKTGFGLKPDEVHFADTRQEKCRIIAASGCATFIDDLREVFSDPEFPSHVSGILFEPEPGPPLDAGLVTCTTWSEISDAVFDGGVPHG